MSELVADDHDGDGGRDLSELLARWRPSLDRGRVAAWQSSRAAVGYRRPYFPDAVLNPRPAQPREETWGLVGQLWLHSSLEGAILVGLLEDDFLGNWGGPGDQ